MGAPYIYDISHLRVNRAAENVSRPGLKTYFVPPSKGGQTKTLYSKSEKTGSQLQNDLVLGLEGLICRVAE